jgi:hybrid polyketide synthase / nonribosomal peptide synthetase ACE1
MHPAIIVPLDKMPKTNSGKLDRRAIAELPLPEVRPDVPSGEDDQDIPLTETEAQLKITWEQFLGFQQRISSSTDFFHIGGSSLLLLQLQARISDEMGTELPPVQMFESSTLGAMVYTIGQGVKRNFGVINWDQETALPPPLLDMLKTIHANHSHDKVDAPRVIVLTGATGELGLSLLERLVKSPIIDKIHCIRVRGARGNQKLEEVASSKVTVYAGNLAHLRIGLSEDDTRKIFGTADTIIHNGADMSYLKTYASLHSTKLESTKVLVGMMARYSSEKAASFHYVSVISVGNFVTGASRGDEEASMSASWDNETSHSQDAQADEFIFRPVCVAAWQPQASVAPLDIAKTAHGYVASKWCSEVFLEKVHERNPNMRVFIHRPSLITRQSEAQDTRNTV